MNNARLEKRLEELLIQTYHNGKDRTGYPDQLVFRDTQAILNAVEAELMEPSVVKDDEQRAAVSKAIEAAWGDKEVPIHNMDWHGIPWKTKLSSLIFDYYSWNDRMYRTGEDKERIANKGAAEIIGLIESAVTSSSAIAIIKKELGPVTSDRHLGEVMQRIVRTVIAGEEQ